MRAELTNGNIQLEASGVPAPTIRQVPGGQYSAELKRWIFPLSWAICVQLRAALGDDMEIGPELSRWAAAERARRVDPATAARAEQDGPDPVAGEIERAGGEFVLEEAQAVDVEHEWWWEIWQGMPEFLQRDLSPWKTLKVHFRSPRDLAAFEQLIGQRVTFKTAAIWYPEAAHLIEQEWRYVTEGEEPLSDTAHTPGRREAAKKWKAARQESSGDRGLDAILQNVGVG